MYAIAQWIVGFEYSAVEALAWNGLFAVTVAPTFLGLVLWRTR